MANHHVQVVNGRAGFDSHYKVLAEAQRIVGPLERSEGAAGMLLGETTAEEDIAVVENIEADSVVPKVLRMWEVQRKAVVENKAAGKLP